MGLKLTKRGETYYIRGTVRKQSVYETCGTSDRELAEAIRIQTENRLLNESVYGKKATINFATAVESYADAGGSRRYLIKVSKRTKTPSGLLVYFNETLLKDITQNDLDAAANKLFPNTTAETRNRQCYTPFIAVWNHAVKNGWADVRLWQRPRKPKGTNVVRLARKKTGTESTSYERAADFISQMSPAPAIVMTALFYTGMRPIELFALRAADVNIGGRWIVIQNSKTGEPRGIPVHEFLAPILESLLKRGSLSEDGRLFRTHKGEPYTPNEGSDREVGGGPINSAIRGARARSGIKDISPYTARHTVSTQLVMAGVHPHIKDQILGHASDSMSRHYTSLPQKTLIEAINTLPVPDGWWEFEWLKDPLAHSGKFIKWGKSGAVEHNKNRNRQ